MKKEMVIERRKARIELQNKLNDDALEILPKVKLSLRQYYSVERLRTCKAYVYHTPDFVVLMSYNTVVAFIDRSTGIMYDVLRIVYGYTATSSQHISKFKADYQYKECITARYPY